MSGAARHALALALLAPALARGQTMLDQEQRPAARRGARKVALSPSGAHFEAQTS